MVRVKICGLKRPHDVELAVSLGADAVGFVLEPTSPRFVADQYEELTLRVPPFVQRVAVFGEYTSVQPGYFEAVQAVQWPLSPDQQVRRIQAVRLRNILPTQMPAEWIGADALLLDAYKEGMYGGTGETVDWSLAAEVVRAYPKRVILAGGLTPDNVAQAIRKVNPYAVDVSTGVESSPGVKDPVKLKDFIQAAKASQI